MIFFGSSDGSVGGRVGHPRVHAVSFLRSELSRQENEESGDGVRNARLWGRMPGVENCAVLEAVREDADVEAVVVSVRIRSRGLGSTPRRLRSWH